MWPSCFSHQDDFRPWPPTLFISMYDRNMTLNFSVEEIKIWLLPPVYCTMTVLRSVIPLRFITSWRPYSASWPRPLLFSMEDKNVCPLTLASLSYFLNGGHKAYLPVYHILTTLALPLFSSFSIEHHDDLHIGLFSPWRTWLCTLCWYFRTIYVG